MAAPATGKVNRIVGSSQPTGDFGDCALATRILARAVNYVCSHATDQRDKDAGVGYFVGPWRAMILSLIWL